MENHIFLFQTSWKDGLSKKIALEYDLSCITGKDHVSFSRKYDLTPQTENERWSFSKKDAESLYFLQTFWKDGLFKKGHTGTWSFLYYLEWWHFFPENLILFLGQEASDDLSQETHGNMIFLFIRKGVTNLVSCPSAKTNQRWSYPAKVHLKVIDVLDWHPRKSSSNSLYFHGDPSRIVQAFPCIALQWEKLNI